MFSPQSASQMRLWERLWKVKLLKEIIKSKIMIHGEPILGNSFLNCRYKVRLCFRENQYQATRFSTVAKWDYGSGRTNISQLVSQLSLSEIMVQGEPISGNSFLNCR